MYVSPGDERRQSRAEWRRGRRAVPHEDRRRVSPRLVIAIAVLQTFIAVAVTVSAAAAANPFGIAIGCALLALALAQLATQWSMRRRLARAAEANRAPAGEPRYPADTT